VKVSNSCARTLIFDSFSLITFLSEFFYWHIFDFFLVFYCLFFFFDFIFIALHFPLFHPYFISFLAHVILSLPYPNLLVIIVVMDLLMAGTHHYYIDVTSATSTKENPYNPNIQTDHHNSTYV
jgi:hypothetical protein